MIIHVVKWGLKPEVTEAEARELSEGLAHSREIPEYRSMVLGPNLAKGDQNGPFTVGYVSTFESIDALEGAGGNEIHKPYSEMLVRRASDIAVLDVVADEFDGPPVGRRCAYHVVAWAFKQGASVEDKRKVLAMVRESGKRPEVRALAFGPNLGRSKRHAEHTHMAVYTFDDVAAIAAYRAEKEFHPRLGDLLLQNTAKLTVLDVEG